MLRFLLQGYVCSLPDRCLAYRFSLVEPKLSTQIRTQVHEFVCQFKNPQFYLPRCFACLYTYGRGCPTDKNCLEISSAHCFKFVLCLRGGPVT